MRRHRDTARPQTARNRRSNLRFAHSRDRSQRGSIQRLRGYALYDRRRVGIRCPAFFSPSLARHVDPKILKLILRLMSIRAAWMMTQNTGETTSASVYITPYGTLFGALATVVRGNDLVTPSP
jgi:hypothetical protein